MPLNVAIIGMAGRFPGAADTGRLWANVLEGRESLAVVSDEDLVRANVSPQTYGRPGYVRVASLLDGFDQFDAAFFGYSPREAALMDPQHRVFLETAWHALEDAGQAPGAAARGARTGVFAGSGGSVSSYATSEAGRWRALRGGTASLHHLAGDKDFLTTRASYKLDLRGPSVAVQTASSSSLVAVHLASQSLRAEECDLALAGGVAVRVPHRVGYLAEEDGILSRDGHCRPFDAEASGTVFGSGVGVVVLKRLEDALADRDPIYAVIRASVVNNDGACKATYAVSSAEGVARACGDALAAAGIRAPEVGLMEAHATGTAVGDPIEFAGLVDAFRRHGASRSSCAIGSLKGNLGHLESAAGVAGLIKAALALHHQVLPPTINVRRVNPALRMDDSPFFLSERRRPWERAAGARLAAVSSLGMGGTNAHVILGDATPGPAASPAVDRPAHVLTLSARSHDALDALATAYALQLRTEGAALADLCFSANTGRAALPHRVAVTGTSAPTMAASLEDLARHEAPGASATPSTDLPQLSRGCRPQEGPRVAFLFPGQGPQYAGMARQLMETQPAFREAIAACETACERLGVPLTSLLRSDEPERLTHTIHAQPALFAVQYALATLLMGWGVRPSACMGHSFGELAAACVTGRMCVEDAMFLACERGRLMQSTAQGGATANVYAPVDLVIELLAAQDEPVCLAAHNSPAECVISGQADAVHRVLGRFEARGVRTRLLRMAGVAFHSAQVDPILNELERVASGITFRPGDPEIEVVSTLSGALASSADLASASYWRRQIREPVRCAEALGVLHARGYDAFVEISPAPSLTFSARAVGASRGDETSLCAAMLSRKREDWEQLGRVLAAMHVRGVPVDWSAFDRGYARERVRLPSYPFERHRHWIEAEGPPEEAPSARPEPAGGVGRRVWSPALRETVYEHEASVGSPWFADALQVRGRSLAPISAFIGLVEAAMRDALGAEAVVLSDVSCLEALDVSLPRTLQVVVRSERTGERSFQVCTRAASAPGGSWTTHVEGKVSTAGAPARPRQQAGAAEPAGDAEPAAPEEVLTGAAFYEQLDAREYRVPAQARLVRRLCRGHGRALAWVDASGLSSVSQPAILEACLHAMLSMVAPSPTEDVAVHVPLGVQRVALLRPLPTVVQVTLRNVEHDARREVCTGDLTLHAEDGRCVGEVRGYCLRRVSWDVFQSRGRESNDWSYELAWHPSPPVDHPPAAPTVGATWLVLADARGLGDALVAALRARGDEVLVVPSLEGHAIGDRRTLLESVGRGDPRRRLSGAINLWPLDADLLAEDDLARRLERTCVGTSLLADALAGSARRPRLHVVTRGGQPVFGSLVDLAQAPAWGAARTLGWEQARLVPICVDLDPHAPQGDLAALLGTVLSSEVEPQVAFRHGRRLVARLVRAASARRRLELPAGGRFEMRLPSRGLLENLIPAPLVERRPGRGQVAIQVKALGVTLRDVLTVLGVTPEGHALGFECAGTIVAVGDGVDGIEVGKEVMALAHTRFASCVIADARLVVRKPAGVRFDQAAALPASYVIAYYALVVLGRAAAGERVLLHAAAGGVGFAAVQLARVLELDVVATASTTKWKFLAAAGLDRVASSRRTGFVDDLGVRRAVDIVLHSLQSRMIAPGLSALRPGGRFVDISSRADAGVPDLSGRSVSYARFDLRAAMIGDAPALGEILQKIAAWVEDGTLPPLPTKVFAPADTVTALRYLAAAQNVGKVVVSLGAPVVATIAPSAPEHCALDYLSTYLVVAGPETLTHALLRQLATMGARHVMVVGPSARIEVSGLDLRWVEVDLSAREAAREALRAQVRSLPPVRGAFFVARAGAGSVHSGRDVVEEALRDVTWAHNLHQVCEELQLPLEHFVLFSSSAASIGAAQGGPRAVAGSFLDALAHSRRASGLCGTSIGWGPWEHEASAHWTSGAAGAMPLERGLGLLPGLLEAAPTHCIVMPTRWRVAVDQDPGLRGIATFSRIIRESSDPRRASSEEAPEIAQLRHMDAKARRAHLLRLLEGMVVSTLGMSEAQRLDPHQGFMEMGLDSMLSVELRNALQTAIQRPLPFALTFNYPTLQALTSHVLALLHPEEDSGAEPLPLVTSPVGEEATREELERMLDDELASMVTAGLVTASSGRG